MSKYFLISILICVFLSFTSHAQKGRIVGRVISSRTGESLVGATISIKKLSKTVKTDQNGGYAFSGISANEYEVTCTYVSYSAKSLTAILLKEGEVVTLDFVMDPAQDLSTVVIKSSGGLKPKETVNSLLVAQKNSASVSDGVSAESIKRTPDKNTGEILKRVSGASLQEDKFAIVRGLNERYNSAYINGAPLPSSESDRKAFAFDIFPSNMLDNLVIYKTATPDMPGEFAGGLIVINTKGIPAENFQSVSFGMGYNTISTFKNRNYYEPPLSKGQWEFLGIDDSRRLPSSFPDIQTYKSFDLKNRIRYGRDLQPKNWGILQKLAFPNSSFQMISGQNIQRKGKDFLGVLLSVTHNRTYNKSTGDRIFYAPEYDNIAQRLYQESVSSAQTLFGVIANVSCKINNNHNLSFKNLFSINADDRVITREGRDDTINEPTRFTKSYALWFTSNKIYTSQLIGEHYLPKTKLRFNWVASYSNIKREIPALRRMAFDSTAGEPSYIAKLFNTSPVDNDNTAGLSFYSVNREEVYNGKIDISRTVKISKSIQSLFKIGAYYQKRNRRFNPRILAISSFNSSKFDNSLLSLSPDLLFAKRNFGNLPNGKTGFAMKDITEIRDQYNAGTELFSYYAMADQRFGKLIRLIYGVRVEEFNQKLNAEYNAFTPIRVDTTYLDVLPSVNLIVSLNNKMNVRLCYSKTLNRPEFRELAPFLFRDYSIRYAIFGDTALRRATIQNYDLRYEFYPGNAQLISVSGFYKKFTDPIELLSVSNQDRTLSYRNTPSAEIIGAEFETRVNVGKLIHASERSVLNDLVVFGNVTLIQSKVNLKVTDTSNFYYNKGRVMQGQSPYVFNAGITYQNDKLNLSSTVSANRYGQRIFLASNGDALQNGELIEPNLWENGRTQIDFQLTKAFTKQRLDLKLNVKDILAQKQVFFEDTNSNKKYDKNADNIRSSFNFGRVISLVISYKF